MIIEDEEGEDFNNILKAIQEFLFKGNSLLDNSYKAHLS
jgi:hypothetical protein